MPTESRTFTTTITQQASLDYLLYTPPGYAPDSGDPWPLLLFLHGMGERGDDLHGVRVHGPLKVAEASADGLPFVIAAPQCPATSWWTLHIHALAKLVEDLVAQHNVDPDRVYLTGLSMGGYGSWHLAEAYPDRFAAVAPICGGADYYDEQLVERICKIKHVPVWAFHGAQDSIVPLEKSEVLVDALEACDGDVLFTVYPEADHDSWTETYSNLAFYDWLLAQRRSGAQ